MLFFSSVSFSLYETINTKKLNKIIDVWKNKKLKLTSKVRYWNNIHRITEVKKTRYLKTAIMDKEWTISLKRDICEGPKYLIPLKEFISL